MLHALNPVAEAAAERRPTVADDPVDVILDGPAQLGSLVANRQGLEAPPVGGSLAYSVAGVRNAP